MTPSWAFSAPPNTRHPRHRLVRPGPTPPRRATPTPTRLRHGDPRHPATPLPRHPRRDHHPRRHDHHPTQPPRLLTRPTPSRPPHRHHRPLVGQPHPALPVRLNPCVEPLARKSALGQHPGQAARPDRQDVCDTYVNQHYGAHGAALAVDAHVLVV